MPHFRHVRGQKPSGHRVPQGDMYLSEEAAKRKGREVQGKAKAPAFAGKCMMERGMEGCLEKWDWEDSRLGLGGCG